ncbi:MAG: iron ABC transporter permease [Ruminococcaceae bacterium]|nr:iron ABC transporter permease [Oscillospiraceae bacterium]
MRGKGYKRIFFSAVLFCVAAALASLCFGAVSLTFSELWGAVWDGEQNTAGYIFLYSRLPRTAACLLAGCALSVSGCILQSVLGNKLASPNIIGVNAGAGLGVALCCALGLLSGWAVSIAAFLGALAAALLIMALARKTGASRTTVILAGVAMNSMLGALRDALTTLVPETASLSGEFRVGGFSSVAMSRLIPAGLLICAALLVTLSLCNDLDVLALGEDCARSLGLRVEPMRFAFLLLAALMAGAAVSFAGLLGFVGLLVPHFARKLCGSESRRLIPLSALGGAGFVTVCDLGARLLFAPHELYVGIVLAVLGGPVFLGLLLRQRGGRSHA